MVGGVVKRRRECSKCRNRFSTFESYKQPSADRNDILIRIHEQNREILHYTQRLADIFNALGVAFKKEIL